MQSLYTWMQAAEVDMTIFFRRLMPSGDEGDERRSPAAFAEAFYDQEKAARHEGELREWLDRYAARVQRDALTVEARRTRMNAANPLYVLRNYLAQEAIDRAEQGDASGVTGLLDVMRQPYIEQPGAERFAARRPDWARRKAGCSMLSCSS